MNRTAAFLLLLLISPFALTSQTVSPKANAPFAGAAKGTLVLHEKQSLLGVPKTASINVETSKVFVIGSSGLYSLPAGSTEGCPVEPQIHRRGNQTIVFVDRSRHDIIFSPRIHPILTNWQPQEIVAVSVTIHGYNLAPRFSSADYRSNNSVGLAKTVDLKLNIAIGKNAETAVTLRSFASISQVDLDAVEYADGTSWNASKQKQACHIVPIDWCLYGARG